jgi:hypothetical protein
MHRREVARPIVPRLVIKRLGRMRAESRMLPERPGAQVSRSIHEVARNKGRAIAKTEAYVVSFAVGTSRTSWRVRFCTTIRG